MTDNRDVEPPAAEKATAPSTGADRGLSTLSPQTTSTPAPPLPERKECDIIPCRRRRRRIWDVPPDSNVNPESPQVIYYLQPPGGYDLQVVVCMENVLRAQQDAARRDPTSPVKGAGQKIKPRCDFEVFEDHSISVGALVDGKKNLKPQTPFYLGRTYQTLETVPSEARKWFSRKHCCIGWSQDDLPLGEATFTLTDLGSANGTYLNGKILNSGSSCALKSGDFIGVSMTEMGKPMLAFQFVVRAIASRVRGLERPRLFPLPPPPVGMRAHLSDAAPLHSGGRVGGGAPDPPVGEKGGGKSRSSDCNCFDCRPDLMMMRQEDRHLASDSTTSERSGVATLSALPTSDAKTLRADGPQKRRASAPCVREASIMELQNLSTRVPPPPSPKLQSTKRHLRLMPHRKTRIAGGNREQAAPAPAPAPDPPHSTRKPKTLPPPPIAPFFDLPSEEKTSGLTFSPTEDGEWQVVSSPKATRKEGAEAKTMRDAKKPNLDASLQPPTLPPAKTGTNIQEKSENLETREPASEEGGAGGRCWAGSGVPAGVASDPESCPAPSADLGGPGAGRVTPAARGLRLLRASRSYAQAVPMTSDSRPFSPDNNQSNGVGNRDISPAAAGSTVSTPSASHFSFGNVVRRLGHHMTRRCAT